MEYGQLYDPNTSFFLQMDALIKRVPHLNVFTNQSENSTYTNHTTRNKNCYWNFNATDVEDSLYTCYATRLKNTVDCDFCNDMEYCGFCSSCSKSNRLFYSEFAHGCGDSMFLFQCRNLHNCFMCTNLQNKEYMIRNKQVTKEEYEAFMREIRTWSHTAMESFREEFEAIKKAVPHRYADNVGSENAVGNKITNSKEVFGSFQILDSEDIRYTMRCINSRHIYDMCFWGMNSELGYELHNCGMNCYNLKFCNYCYNNMKDAEYSMFCMNCEHVFGCMGLRHKKFCILNVQYTEEEYFALVHQIKANMTRDGEYGEFFPERLSPYAYNETIANDVFPLTREGAEQLGVAWIEDLPQATYNGSWFEPSNDVRGYASPEEARQLLQGVLRCEATGLPFRITAQELAFYLKYNLSLPRISPNERFRRRAHPELFFAMYNRTCQNTQRHDTDGQCMNSFVTSYSPDRPEKVFCEDCYQHTVL